MRQGARINLETNLNEGWRRCVDKELDRILGAEDGKPKTELVERRESSLATGAGDFVGSKTRNLADRNVLFH